MTNEQMDILIEAKTKSEAEDYIASLRLTEAQMTSFLEDEFGIPARLNFNQEQLIYILMQNLVGREIDLRALRKSVRGKV